MKSLYVTEVIEGPDVCRSSISFEAPKPPREDSFENFKEIEKASQSDDIGKVFEDKKKEIVKAYEAGVREVEEEPDIEYSIYTIGGGNGTERRQNKRPITATVVEIRDIISASANPPKHHHLVRSKPRLTTLQCGATARADIKIGSSGCKLCSRAATV